MARSNRSVRNSMCPATSSLAAFSVISSVRSNLQTFLVHLCHPQRCCSGNLGSLGQAKDCWAKKTQHYPSDTGEEV